MSYRRRRTSKNLARHSRLHVERLERRDLMAGNVTVRFEGGDMLITGDGASNAFEIRPTGVLDQFDIVGLTWRGAPTTINSRSVLRFNNYAFSDDLIIRTGGGDDYVKLRGANSSSGDLDAWNDLIIETDSGNDRVHLLYVEAGGQGAADSDILIYLGTGSNQLAAQYTEAADDFRVSSPDILQSLATTNRLSLSNLTVGDELTVNLYHSTDIVNISSCVCDELYVSMFRGFDRISVRNSRLRTGRIDGGTGTDTVYAYRNTLTSIPQVGIETYRVIDSAV